MIFVSIIGSLCWSSVQQRDGYSNVLKKAPPYPYDIWLCKKWQKSSSTKNQNGSLWFRLRAKSAKRGESFPSLCNISNDNHHIQVPPKNQYSIEILCFFTIHMTLCRRSYLLVGTPSMLIWDNLFFCRWTTMMRDADQVISPDDGGLMLALSCKSRYKSKYWLLGK